MTDLRTYFTDRIGQPVTAEDCQYVDGQLRQIDKLLLDVVQLIWSQQGPKCADKVCTRCRGTKVEQGSHDISMSLYPCRSCSAQDLANLREAK